MPFWKYKVIQLLASDDDVEETQLNAWGSDGWELVSVLIDHGYVYAYLKRSYT